MARKGGSKPFRHVAPGAERPRALCFRLIAFNGGKGFGFDPRKAGNYDS